VAEEPAAIMEILCEVRNSLACVTLNRPAALNALSLGMVEELKDALERFAADPGIRGVLLQGAGEKAFCAGGDVRALYDSFHGAGTLHNEFFAREYPLDYQLHQFPKPYIALINGIVMGGGMGIAQGSRLRIVGDRTRMAMPEVGIGFFPDVGATYFLSRLPGALGLYLALTGTQIRAADTLYAGLADYYLPPAAMKNLQSELDTLRWSAQGSEADRSDLEQLLGRLAGDAGVAQAGAPKAGAVQAGEAPLAKLRSSIDRHFAAASVPELLASLDRESRPEYAQWAQDTRKLLLARSPTMLAVTLRQIHLGRSMNLADCLRMELGMVRQCFAHGDFMEGVRAVIVEKDNAPRWRPQRIEEVTAASVDAIFRDPWAGGVHPLANLEGESRCN
jgi:enoyl-CoA hydratase/carnithine racemase